ncbi:hypothetical protein C2845_PM14G17690 [Panicum miliaceum]|uniref:Uncharacterized protein n=1 Tax=Panicum miliaceum TaxID=4540 RepID=A0A3L6PP56_PANMI|nr:hypothetical protein C2845_PM14G17690 [Panicum miliaceum]
MAHNLIVTMLILVVVGVVATPFAYASKSPTSSQAKEPKAATKSNKTAAGPVEALKAAAEGPGAVDDGLAASPKATAEGPGAAMKWPTEGPQFVKMIIKHPFFKTPPPSSSSSSDGLPTDPTPEGSMS